METSIGGFLVVCRDRTSIVPISSLEIHYIRIIFPHSLMTKNQYFLGDFIFNIQVGFHRVSKASPVQMALHMQDVLCLAIRPVIAASDSKGSPNWFKTSSTVGDSKTSSIFWF